MKRIRIVAAILTHNRIKLLKRCLNSIKNQERKCDEVLVINNGSSDGTETYLSSSKILHINNENSGSALGWYTAIEYAKKNKYDLIWLMDDDGYADSKALGNLIEKYEITRDSCISSIVLQEENKNILVFPIPILNDKNFPIIFRLKRKYKTLKECEYISQDNLIPFAHLFNGSLINLKYVNKVGGIDLRYFHHGVELDYLYRLFQSGKVSTCCKAFHYHPNTELRKINMLWIYYYLKNTLIINSKYLDYVLIRNSFTIFLCLIRIIKRNGLKYFFYDFIFSNKIIFFWLAMIKGFKKKLGKDELKL